MNYFLNMTSIQFQFELWKVELWVTSAKKKQKQKVIVSSFLKLYALGLTVWKQAKALVKYKYI